MRPRHIPIRTCAGCRAEFPKRDMVRVVRASDRSVSVDPTGKRAGRGTYVCPRDECWQQALRSGSLARVLKTEISPDDRIALQTYASTIAASSGEPAPTNA